MFLKEELGPKFTMHLMLSLKPIIGIVASINIPPFL
jgi:hypothetical protein